MKLYILKANDYDEALHGIFSSEEKARNVAASMVYGQQEGFVIEVTELDEVVDPEYPFVTITEYISIPGIKVKKPSKWRT